MKNYDRFLFPVYLIAVGIICACGVNIFGSAIFEGAAWKQNVIMALFIIFGLMPPFFREMKSTWMVAGFVLAFFLFGGANFLGTVGIMIGIEKILLTIFVLFLGFRVWSETWMVNRLYMIFPALALISTALLLPIEDQNIVGSTFNMIKNWSVSGFTSDHGFHVYLGLTGVFSGISEILTLNP